MSLIKDIISTIKNYPAKKRHQEEEKKQMEYYVKVLEIAGAKKLKTWPPILEVECPFCNPKDKTPAFKCNNDVDFINHMVKTHGVTMHRAEIVYLIVYFQAKEKYDASV